MCISDSMRRRLIFYLVLVIDDDRRDWDLRMKNTIKICKVRELQRLPTASRCVLRSMQIALTLSRFVVIRKTPQDVPDLQYSPSSLQNRHMCPSKINFSLYEDR